MADNLARIRESIGARPVKLIAVTKYVGPQEMAEAFRSGVTEFGESKVQDALEKQELLSSRLGQAVNWHMIGHLQTNKVKKAIGRFSLIHSVDSLKLAQEISKTAQKLSCVQAVLLQVKMAEDPSKSGFTPDQLRQSFPELAGLVGLKIDGLMTITPLCGGPEQWRQCFAGLRDLRDELSERWGVELKELSMGMSQDWQEAVRCGATMVRLGKAIFESSQ